MTRPAYVVDTRQDVDFPTSDPRQCRLLPLWTALFEQRPFQVAVVLVVRQPEAVAASLVSRDQLPLDRAMLLWLSHRLEAKRATRQLPRLVLSYEQLLQGHVVALQRCQQLAGLSVTAPPADLLREWIQSDLNRHQGSPEAVKPKGVTQTLLQWANTVYAALVEPAAAQQRQLLDRAQAVVQQKLQALLEQGSRRVQLQLFWEPKAGGGFFGSGFATPRGDGGAGSRPGGVSAPCRRRAPAPVAAGTDRGAGDGDGIGHPAPQRFGYSAIVEICIAEHPRQIESTASEGCESEHDGA